ncbi:hypothetical protein D3C71_2064630 [compost metagenome]
MIRAERLYHLQVPEPEHMAARACDLGIEKLDFPGVGEIEDQHVRISRLRRIKVQAVP